MKDVLVIGGVVAAGVLLYVATRRDPGKPAEWDAGASAIFRAEYGADVTSYSAAAERALQRLPARPSVRDLWSVGDFWREAFGPWNAVIGGAPAMFAETPAAAAAYQAFATYVDDTLGWADARDATPAHIDGFKRQLRTLARALDGDKHTEYVDRGLFGNTVANVGEGLGSFAGSFAAGVGNALGNIGAAFATSFASGAAPVLLIGGGLVVAYLVMR